MDTGPEISWSNLLRTVQHFTALNFTYVEVPWLVSKEATRATFSGNPAPLFHGKYVVGSAEQSFIEMQLQGKLPPGNYVALSPCFREEDTETELNRFSFMKVELYLDVTKLSKSERTIRLAQVGTQCMQWFMILTQGYEPFNLSFVGTDDGFDIELNGIEIGSYGIRTFNDVSWIYATGLAEPRFLVALKRSA